MYKIDNRRDGSLMPEFSKLCFQNPQKLSYVAQKIIQSS